MNVQNSSFSIRAGAFHGPAMLAVGNVHRFENTLRSLDLPTDAEDIVRAETYLRGMHEIDQIARQDLGI